MGGTDGSDLSATVAGGRRLHSWRLGGRTANALSLVVVSGFAGGMFGGWVHQALLGSDEATGEVWAVASVVFGIVRVSVSSLTHRRLDPGTCTRVGAAAGAVGAAAIFSQAGLEGDPGNFAAYGLALLTTAGATVLSEMFFARRSRWFGQSIAEAAVRGAMGALMIWGILGWWAQEPGGVPAGVLVTLGASLCLGGVAIEVDERRTRRATRT